MISCTFEDGGKADPGLRHVVVDVLVLRVSNILLVKRSQKLSTEPGKWAVVGGFMSRDETAVQAAQREVKEETGYKITDMTMLTIVDTKRPHEDRQNVSIVFFANALEKVGESDWEVDDQKWFSLDDLPPEEQIAFDHFKMIQLYKRYQQDHFSLPHMEGLQ